METFRRYGTTKTCSVCPFLINSASSAALTSRYVRNRSSENCASKAPHLRSRYYTGAKVAPVLTLVIGGNHEASNYMWELYAVCLSLTISWVYLWTDFTAVGLLLVYSSWATLVASR